MPPKKNVAPTDAIRRFWCGICSKGYPRQPDYENHLRSYDHNHRQRMADMKKLTTQNEADASQKRRGGDDMRAIPLGDQNAKKPRFTKVAGDNGAARFRKIGTSSKAEDETAPFSVEKKAPSMAELLKQKEELDRQIAAVQASDGHPGMEVTHEEDMVTWEEFPLAARIRAGGNPWQGLKPEDCGALEEMTRRYGLV